MTRANTNERREACGFTQSAAAPPRNVYEDATQRPDTPADHANKILEADAAHRSLAADQTLMMRMLMPSVKAQWSQLAQGLYSWFRHQGFWPKQSLAYSSPHDSITITMGEYIRLKKAEKIALIHSELSEMLEAVRKGDDRNEAEELADTQVRILDYVGGFGTELGQAFEDKMIKNYSRPFRHGKEF